MSARKERIASLDIFPGRQEFTVGFFEPADPFLKRSEQRRTTDLVSDTLDAFAHKIVLAQHPLDRALDDE